MDDVMKSLGEILAGVPANSELSIIISVDGTAPINKKCYKWVNGMMVQVRCDSPEVEGAIEY